MSKTSLAREETMFLNDDTDVSTSSNSFHWTYENRRVLLSGKPYIPLSERVSTFFRINFPKNFPYSLRNKKRRIALARLTGPDVAINDAYSHADSRNNISHEYIYCGSTTTSIQNTPPEYLSTPFDQGTLHSGIKAKDYETIHRRKKSIWHAFKQVRRKIKQLQRKKSEKLANNGQNTTKTINQVLTEVKFLAPEPFYIGQNYSEDTVPASI
ncbi:hypothetical protein RNJ44_05070 [Nakaseomyces bracarensis]|uniref:Uncharacterized protein n=1 Tax=Nakaseomyces bracarensis TaxID=273131 RepID=A0ABR4NWL9_9SACH